MVWLVLLAALVFHVSYVLKNRMLASNFQFQSSFDSWLLCCEIFWNTITQKRDICTDVYTPKYPAYLLTMCAWFSWGLRSREAVFHSSCFFKGLPSLAESTRIYQKVKFNCINSTECSTRTQTLASQCISPWKKCSFEACCSSFSAGILWLSFCRSAFPLPASSFPGGEGVATVWPGSWFNKPAGVKGVTVSSRILLSWMIHSTTWDTQKCRALWFHVVSAGFCVCWHLFIVFPLLFLHFQLCSLPLLLQLLLFTPVLLLHINVTHI